MTRVMDAAPDVLGRYRLLDEIGRGAMGRVYRAHDPNIERQVALKVLYPLAAAQSASDFALRERFVLEARAAGRLSHPGIATIYDADVDPEQDLAFIAMELVDGESLAQMLEGEKQPPLERLCEIAGQVAEALDYAHARDVVHRDVKPANILLTSDGCVKLVDFGIAKLVEVSHTLTGQVIGTPAYMSPEQFRAESIDGRSDLFSLGSVLYEGLAGEKPFRGETISALAHQICAVDPPRPETEIPDELWRLVRRALAKEREDRFATGGELADALSAFRPVVSGRSPRPDVAPRNDGRSGGNPIVRALGLERRYRWLAAAALVLLVALGAAWSASSRRATAVGSAVEPAASATAEEPAAHGAATLVVLHETRLKEALMTIQIDGEEVWSQRIGARGKLLSRARGSLVRAVLPLRPGRHTIEVAVRGAKGKVDAAAVASTEFEAGQIRYLRAKLLPIVDRLDLDWKG